MLDFSRLQPLRVNFIIRLFAPHMTNISHHPITLHSHTNTHTPPQSHTQTHTLSATITNTNTHSHTLTHTITITHTHTHTRTHTPPQSHTHKHTHTRSRQYYYRFFFCSSFHLPFRPSFSRKRAHHWHWTEKNAIFFSDEAVTWGRCVEHEDIHTWCYSGNINSLYRMNPYHVSADENVAKQ